MSPRSTTCRAPVAGDDGRGRGARRARARVRRPGHRASRGRRPPPLPGPGLEEVARILDIPNGTARSRLHYAPIGCGPSRRPPTTRPIVERGGPSMTDERLDPDDSPPGSGPARSTPPRSSSSGRWADPADAPAPLVADRPRWTAGSAAPGGRRSSRPCLASGLLVARARPASPVDESDPERAAVLRPSFELTVGSQRPSSDPAASVATCAGDDDGSWSVLYAGGDPVPQPRPRRRAAAGRARREAPTSARRSPTGRPYVRFDPAGAPRR